MAAETSVTAFETKATGASVVLRRLARRWPRVAHPAEHILDADAEHARDPKGALQRGGVAPLLNRDDGLPMASARAAWLMPPALSRNSRTRFVMGGGFGKPGALSAKENDLGPVFNKAGNEQGEHDDMEHEVAVPVNRVVPQSREHADQEDETSPMTGAGDDEPFTLIRRRARLPRKEDRQRDLEDDHAIVVIVVVVIPGEGVALCCISSSGVCGAAERPTLQIDDRLPAPTRPKRRTIAQATISRTAIAHLVCLWVNYGRKFFTCQIFHT